MADAINVMEVAVACVTRQVSVTVVTVQEDVWDVMDLDGFGFAKLANKLAIYLAIITMFESYGDFHSFSGITPVTIIFLKVPTGRSRP